jgi:cephalosporin hydroxylase
VENKAADVHSAERPEGAEGSRGLTQAASKSQQWDTFSSVVIAIVLGFLGGSLYFVNHPTVAATLRSFHIYNYTSYESTWANTTWLGVPAQKSPQDMWIYQEIIAETHPDVLIEAGTADGGSAYYFATVFDAVGRGRVITIDIVNSPKIPKHNRINFLLGSSTAPEIVAKVKSLIAPGERVMVSLDSDHHKEHVAQELRIYSELVTKGCYLVVEDTDINGHPVYPSFGPGPMEALRDFLRVDHRFVSDHSREKFQMTFFPDGWLRRVS